jgi:hypothetical protein
MRFAPARSCVTSQCVTHRAWFELWGVTWVAREARPQAVLVHERLMHNQSLIIKITNIFNSV